MRVMRLVYLLVSCLLRARSNPENARSDLDALEKFAVDAMQTGMLDDAREILQDVLLQDPRRLQAMLRVGEIYGMSTSIPLAIRIFRMALRAFPGEERPYQMLGKALRIDHQEQPAERILKRGVALFSESHQLNMEVALTHLMHNQYEQSLDYILKAQALKPDWVQAATNVAAVYYFLKRWDDALPAYEAALKLAPGDSLIARNMAAACEKMHQQQRALDLLENAVDENPSDRNLFCRMVEYRRKLAKWDDFEDDMAMFAVLVDDGNEPCLDSMPTLAYPLSSETFRSLAIKHAQLTINTAPPAPPDAVPLLTDVWKSRHKRFRIGYLSSDFKDHPVGHLIHTAIAMHSRTDLEVFAYMLGKPDSSKEYHTVREGVEHYHDVRTLPNKEAISLIRSHELSIMIALNGYTDDARCELLVAKLAPVQITYLGFMGSLGGIVDHYAADRVVLPPELIDSITEKVVYLPEQFMVNDHPALHPAEKLLHVQNAEEVTPEQIREMRSNSGLPVEPFIFANFNQMYKIEPPVFDTWMRVLRRTNNTVMWLQKFPDDAVPHLRRRAKMHGVDPSRIVFSHRVSRQVHVQLKSLADLHLDTSMFNAHSTALDHLWAGVAGITRPSYTPAGRVGASLHLVGVKSPHGLVRTLDEYEELAVRAATVPRVRAFFKRRIREGRIHGPLFQVRRWVAHFEMTVKLVWEAAYWTDYRFFHVIVTHTLPEWYTAQ